MLARLRTSLTAFYGFMERPLSLWSRPLLVALLVALGLSFLQPLWAVSIRTPQHADALWLDLYATHVSSGHGGADLVQINVLHQALGMSTIDGRTLGDLDWLPFGLGVLGLLVLRVAAVGNVRSLIDAAVLNTYFAAFTLLRFAQKVHTLGTNLSADAPTTVAPFTPVLFGSQQIGDVTVQSGPGAGAWLVAAFVLGVAIVAVWHLREGKRETDERAAHKGAAT